MKLLRALPLIAMLVGTNTVADTLQLSNGKSMEGTLVGRDKGIVKFKTKEGVVVSLDEKDVKNIVLGSANSGATAASKKAATTAAKPAEAQATGPITLPAGTVMRVRLKESINSRKQSSGHKFTAILETDLLVKNNIALKKGANIYGVLQSVKQARRVIGKSEMTLSFTGVMINNQIIPLKAGEIKAVAESGSGQETAGRAARYAAIGALADGSSGAKTGAKIGLGVSLLTRGGSIDIPAGTLLDFPLAAPLTL